MRPEPPGCISFSGGRTSAYMLWRTLDMYGGTLPPGLHVVFANTGMEREETLEFVQECGTRWDAPIAWVEYRPPPDHLAVVDFTTASRNGEPFTALIRRRNMLPNPVTRFCTQELKIRAMKRWMVRHGGAITKRGSGRGVSGGAPYWTNYVGIRADEPRRLHRKSNKLNDLHDVAHPLAAWGVTRADVHRFWAAQPFDLQLRSWEGNCTLCFLKGTDKIIRIMRERPELAEWWRERESLSAASRRVRASALTARGTTACSRSLNNQVFPASWMRIMALSSIACARKTARKALPAE